MMSMRVFGVISEASSSRSIRKPVSSRRVTTFGTEPRHALRELDRHAPRILVHTQQSTPIDADRLPADVAGLLRAEERARRAKLRRVAEPAHWRGRGHPLHLLVGIGAACGSDLADAVGEAAVGR